MKLSRALFGIVFIFIIDQITKWWIIESVIKPDILPATADASMMPFFEWLLRTQDQMPFARIDILPFFNIVMVWNKGISFGLFTQHGDTGPLLLSAFSAIVAAGLFIWLLRAPRMLTALALVLVIGGALGNILDRLRFGAVADFLDIHAFGWHWPAFNMADSCITIGIAMLLIDGLFFDKTHSKKEKEAPVS